VYLVIFGALLSVGVIVLWFLVGFNVFARPDPLQNTAPIIASGRLLALSGETGAGGTVGTIDGVLLKSGALQLNVDVDLSKGAGNIILNPTSQETDGTLACVTSDGKLIPHKALTVSANGDVTIPGDLSVGGSIISELRVADAMIDLAVGNENDNLNTGLVIETDGGKQFSGLVRGKIGDVEQKRAFVLFDSATTRPEPTDSALPTATGVLHLKDLTASGIVTGDNVAHDNKAQLREIKERLAEKATITHVNHASDSIGQLDQEMSTMRSSVQQTRNDVQTLAKETRNLASREKDVTDHTGILNILPGSVLPTEYAFERSLVDRVLARTSPAVWHGFYFTIMESIEVTGFVASSAVIQMEEGKWPPIGIWSVTGLESYIHPTAAVPVRDLTTDPTHVRAHCSMSNLFEDAVKLDRGRYLIAGLTEHPDVTTIRTHPTLTYVDKFEQNTDVSELGPTSSSIIPNPNKFTGAFSFTFRRVPNNGSIRMPPNANITPTASSRGIEGEMTWGVQDKETYIYICHATDSWRRILIPSTWSSTSVLAARLTALEKRLAALTALEIRLAVLEKKSIEHTDYDYIGGNGEGTTGQMTWSNDPDGVGYIYVCVSDNYWKRTRLDHVDM
jgi:hypothetical protein